MPREALALENTGKLSYFMEIDHFILQILIWTICLSYRNTSKKALTNDLIEGLEKDLERFKRIQENLRIRKLHTMKGGDKIVNETDQDRYNAAITNLHADVEGRGAHIIHGDLERQ